MNVPSCHAARRPHRGGGFSLIELVAVLVIAAIMAAVAVPTLSSLAATRAWAAAKLVARDLTYARERAMTTGLRTWVGFKTGEVLYDRKERAAGEAQQTLGKLLRYALDVILIPTTPRSAVRQRLAP